MPWKKSEVQGVGGYKGTGWIFRKGDGDDSGDDDGEDSYPGGPDDHALVIHSPWQCEEYRNNVAQDERHAPVQDDEINFGEPSPRRRRIGAMRQQRREGLFAASHAAGARLVPKWAE